MDRSFIQYIPALLASYEQVGVLNNNEAHNLPSTRAVGLICEDLLQILFPGFHDDDAIHHGSIADLTVERMARVVAKLSDQVRRSVRIGAPRKPTGKTPPIIDAFCKSLPDIRETLRTDI